MFRRNIVGKVSARRQYESVRSPGGKTDYSILPGRNQPETEGQGKLEVAGKSQPVLSRHVLHQVQIELFVNGEGIRPDLANVLQDLGAITADEEYRARAGLFDDFQSLLYVRSNELLECLRSDLGGHGVDNADDLASHFRVILG